jgi:hypothetical protein
MAPPSSRSKCVYIDEFLCIYIIVLKGMRGKGGDRVEIDTLWDRMDSGPGKL